jgi:cytochrome d ubiquinol oxidase subunit I
MEGLWETTREAPAVLFALPDESAWKNRHELAIPGLASLYLGHSLSTEVRGLNEFPDAHPPVAPVFWAFRLMVGTGVLMLLVSWSAAWQLRRHGQLGPLLGRVLVWMTFSGWIALVAGWYVTEIGRQPWLVQGLLRTADAVAPTSVVSAGKVGLTLAMYLTLYAVLLVAFVSVLFHLARQAAGNGLAKKINPAVDPFRANDTHDIRAKGGKDA